MKPLRDELPGLYADLLPAWFAEVSIPERRATCDDCAMCGESSAPRPIVRFSPDTKCCTYHPKLPNYLVGSLLATDDPLLVEGQRRVRERIASRIGITPQWVSPSKKYSVLLSAARGSSFGRSETLRCPFYERDGGRCTIWRHRESDCSTFFCKVEAGEDGRSLWRAIGSFLGTLEVKLSSYALGKVAPEIAEPPKQGALTLEELEERPPPPDVYARWWTGYRGREEELYVRCFECIRDVSRDQAQALYGAAKWERDVALLGTLRSETESARLPDRLVRSSDLEVHRGEVGLDWVVAYSRYDPAVLPSRVLAALDAFDGSTSNEEARKRLTRAGLSLSNDDVVNLHRQRILVPVESDSTDE